MIQEENKWMTFAILSISMITVMASAAVSPALANISNAFPDTDTNVIKTILTLPSLFIIPFSLFSSYLVNLFGNKKVLIGGIIIYIIGGIAPAFASTIPQLLFFRAILGCGCGLIMPISQSLIAINYKDSLRTKITGYSGAASYFMGVIASFFVGPVSSINWHYSFYIYLVAVLVLILNIIALPGDKPIKTEQKINNKQLSGKTWLLIIGLLLVNIAFYAVPSNVALFMKEQGIGTPQSAGTVISAFMITGFLAGLALSFIQKQLRGRSIIFGIMIMGIGYLLLSLAENLITTITGSAFVGFSFGVLFPSFLIQINHSCNKSQCIWALSVASCAQFLGQFLSPYVLQSIKNIIGFYSLRIDFVILAFCLSSFAIYHIVVKENIFTKIYNFIIAYIRK